MTDEKTRGEFEEWAYKDPNYPTPFIYITGRYLDDRLDSSYRAWQAATRFCQQEIEKAYDRGFMTGREMSHD